MLPAVSFLVCCKYLVYVRVHWYLYDSSLYLMSCSSPNNWLSKEMMEQRLMHPGMKRCSNGCVAKGEENIFELQQVGILFSLSTWSSSPHCKQSSLHNYSFHSHNKAVFQKTFLSLWSILKNKQKKERKIKLPVFLQDTQLVHQNLLFLKILFCLK